MKKSTVCTIFMQRHLKFIGGTAMKLSQLLEDFQSVRIQGNGDPDISDVVYDSRKVVPGCVFVCLKGFETDGHKYAREAADKGAAAIVLSECVPLPESVLVIKTDDTRAALAQMSAAYFGHPAKELKTIALTGTKGKTTTVSMIRSILEKGGIKTGTIGTLGIVIGEEILKTNNTTPESYEIQQAMRLMVDKGCKCMVIEASSLGLKWHRTDGQVFDYGVFTNFSHDHIGPTEHESIEEYRACKSLLFRQCKTGIVNCDDPEWQNILKDHTCTVETYGFGEQAQLRAYDEGLVSRPGYLGVHFSTKGVLKLTVNVPIPGRFSVYNALAAIAVCRNFDISEQAIIDGLNVATVKGRVEPVKVPGDYTLLIDYAHNAVSMENVLKTLREYKPNRLITLFGAGGNRPKIRRYEMGEISGKLSDLSVLTADNSRFENVMDIIADIETGIRKTNGKYIVIPDRKEAIRYCMATAKPGDIIVLAGKGHEDYQEIKGVKYHLDEREVIADILKESQAG